MWKGPFEIEVPPDPPAEPVPPIDEWEPWAVRRVALAALKSVARTLAVYLWLVIGVLWGGWLLGLERPVAVVIAAILAWFAIDLNRGFVRDFKAHTANLTAMYHLAIWAPGSWVLLTFDYEAYLGCWRVRIVSSSTLRALAAQKDTGTYDHDQS